MSQKCAGDVQLGKVARGRVGVSTTPAPLPRGPDNPARGGRGALTLPICKDRDFSEVLPKRPSLPTARRVPARKKPGRPTGRGRERV